MMSTTEKDNERGGVSISLLQFSFLIFILAFTLASISLRILATQRSGVQAHMESLLKDSIKAAINVPLPQAIDTDQATLQSTVVQLYAEKLKISSGSVIINKFTVFTDNDAGSQAVGIKGVIPGRSVYVDLLVTWTPPSVMGVHYTGTYPVRSLVALPTFFSPGQTWN